jgi:hypothetical protein
MNQKEMEAKIAELTLAIGMLTERVTIIEDGKQRGPKTERPMTDADAFRVKFGDLKELSHKDAAAELKLSYGQVFSCRGGYTFKHVKDGSRNADGSEKPKPNADGGAK